MAEQTITLLDVPAENGVHLAFEPTDVPMPAFIEIEDSDGTMHRYVPAEQLEAEHALNAELVEMLRVFCNLTDGFRRLPANPPEGPMGGANRNARALIAKAEAREKRDE